MQVLDERKKALTLHYQTYLAIHTDAGQYSINKFSDTHTHTLNALPWYIFTVCFFSDNRLSATTSCLVLMLGRSRVNSTLEFHSANIYCQGYFCPSRRAKKGIFRGRSKTPEGGGRFKSQVAARTPSNLSFAHA